MDGARGCQYERWSSSEHMHSWLIGGHEILAIERPVGLSLSENPSQEMQIPNSEQHVKAMFSES